MEATRLCPYCLQPLPDGAQSCPHCGKSFAGRNPGGTLPVGTVLAGRYTVGEMLSIDGEGILYRGAENLGRFRVTIKEYLPITLTAERTVGMRPEQARCVLPLCLKTEIVLTANYREWRNIFKLRTPVAAHPQMRELMCPLLKELQSKIPVVFDDIYTYWPEDDQTGKDSMVK